MDSDYSATCTRPEQAMQKMRLKKRALTDRIFQPHESPRKKTKRGNNDESQRKGSFGKRPNVFKSKPPPPDELTNEDTTLMELIAISKPTSFSTNLSFDGQITPTKAITNACDKPQPFGTSPENESKKSLTEEPLVNNSVESNVPLVTPTKMQSTLKSMSIHSPNPNTSSYHSPMEKYLPSTIGTPQHLKKVQVKPAPDPVSPFSQKSNWSTLYTFNSRKRLLFHDSQKASAFVSKKPSFVEEGYKKPQENANKWHDNLCIDWSLKTRLIISSKKTYGWDSNLKSCEISSGTSSFVRCLDPASLEDSNSNNSMSQIDTSLGAQFYQCCLYWQHPFFPSTTIFPRLHRAHENPVPNSNNFNRLFRPDATIENEIYIDWIESIKSVFQLIRTRQCPYFYVCANTFTCLFCAAGTQGYDYIQVYVTPSTKGFRDSLRKEGIEFCTPHSTGEDVECKQNVPTQNDEDEDTDKWLDDMGISQDLNLTSQSHLNESLNESSENNNEDCLVTIVDKHCLSFFNFFINSYNLVISPTGAYAGIPPTILAPVAFKGANLRSLKVKHTKRKSKTQSLLNCIEMTGPILPNVLHSLCFLLRKTVGNFKVHASTLKQTTFFNLNSVRSKVSKPQKEKPSVFDIQNLSDCGLNGKLLELFCSSDNCDTIDERIECKNSMFRWS